jgi:hypothetical protein
VGHLTSWLKVCLYPTFVPYYLLSHYCFVTELTATVESYSTESNCVCVCIDFVCVCLCVSWLGSLRVW